MTLSMVLAWIAVVCVIGTAWKYIARISKSVKLNRMFHKIHIPMGVVLIITGLIHGLLAGNFMDTTLSNAKLGTVLFTLNWGTACFAVSILLGISYLCRKICKKNWMNIHRVLTICMLILVIIHIVDVGIQLPSRVLTLGKDSTDIQDKGAGELDEVQENVSATFSGAQLKDGTYEGSANGYQSTIKVAVTVENSAVTDIEILEANDTPNYFERAKGIIEDIVNQQSLEVDAVSGATYSSVGIIHAVNDALESAVVEGELESNDTEVPSNSPQEHKGKNRHGNRHNRK